MSQCLLVESPLKVARLSNHGELAASAIERSSLDIEIISIAIVIVRSPSGELILNLSPSGSSPTLPHWSAHNPHANTTVLSSRPRRLPDEVIILLQLYGQIFHLLSGLIGS